jgi:hypothetical protein
MNYIDSGGGNRRKAAVEDSFSGTALLGDIHGAALDP